MTDLDYLFEVVQETRTWIRKMIPEPSYKIYFSHVFIVLAIINLKEKEIPARYSEIESCITAAARSSVTRGIKIFLNRSFIKKSNDDTYDFVVDVPKNLLQKINGSKSNNHEIKVDKVSLDAIKSVIKRELAKIPSITPENKGLVVDIVDDIKVNDTEEDEPEDGVSSILGSMRL